MAPEPRAADRTSYYTVKTSGRQQTSPSHSHTHSRSGSYSQSCASPPHGHAHTNSQSVFTNKAPAAPPAPMVSPRVVHSASGGQGTYRPSPGTVTGRVSAPDARTSSPNYFGLSAEPAVDPRDSVGMHRDNWSPATSSVKSFGAAISHVPLDANPEFEAFERQADANQGRSAFTLSSSYLGSTSSTSGLNRLHILSASMSSAQPQPRPRPSPWHTCGSSLWETHVSAEPTRNPATPVTGLSTFLSQGWHESPAQVESRVDLTNEPCSRLSRVDQDQPRLSMAQDRADPPSPHPKQRPPRADTVPLKMEPGGPELMTSLQLQQLLDGVPRNTLLLLDLRVSPQYAQSRIKGALNLCIPTTLLKRATYNLPKLEQTFQSEADREQFTKWRDTTHLVVYDAFSQDKRDAVPGMNMIKKFTSEGYTGSTFILRGGFHDFALAHPGLVDSSPLHGPPKPSLSLSGTNNGSGRGPGKTDADVPGAAPVIGGVVLPQASHNLIPFFNNIRQNQDLIDGVGQLEVGVPQGLDAECLPLWLRQAVSADDKGKKVADQFLGIELKEQLRMKAAYSMFSNAITIHFDDLSHNVQLSGIEKGGKNRYKDILPFEHARVKLQGREQGSCDYVNASHVQARGSHKRYIASQGPLPATFEDFWSVIWDQDVRVVVMLTAESEGGQLKCHPYWQGREYGPLKLRTLSEKKVSLDMDKYRPPATFSEVHDCPASATAAPGEPSPPHTDTFSWAASSSTETGRRRANTTTRLDGVPNSALAQAPQQEIPFVVIRKFALSHAAHPFAAMREITHLHYSSWPDFGAPAQPSHLLALVELANVMQRTATGNDSFSQQQHQRKRSGPAPPEASIAAGVLPSGAAKRRSWGRDHLVDYSWYDAPEREVRPRPMLVHCSAGCGRTGTFCTVDSVIDMLKRQSLKAVRRAARRRTATRESDGHDQDRKVRDWRAGQPEMKWRQSNDAEGDARMVEMDALVASHPAVVPDADAVSISSVVGADDASEEGDNFGGSSTSSSTSNGSCSEEERTLDTSWLASESVDLIARAVDDFRGQRLSMVQSLRQYVLCYETVLEWIARLQERRAGGDGRPRTRTGSMVW